MYRVIIVGEDKLIVEGLAGVVPWAKYSCRVIATASDIAHATELIRQTPPHILFTDIRMADGDGLSMLAELKPHHPDMQVTVLTGYRDFSYAHRAIRLGVVRFLLKPSSMEELEEALAAMTRNLRTLNILPQEEQAPPDLADSFLVRQAMAYIQERCTEKISLQDAADSCYISPWHLSKLLNKQTGQKFYDILNAARIALAKQLMADPSLRIGDIARQVGYRDSSHFSRVFKKMEGISANEYRNGYLG